MVIEGKMLLKKNLNFYLRNMTEKYLFKTYVEIKWFRRKNIFLSLRSFMKIRVKDKKDTNKI